LDIKELKRKKKVKVRDENLTLDDLPGGIQDKKKKKEEKGSDDDDDDDSDSEQSYEDDNDLNKELILENDQKKKSPDLSNSRFFIEQKGIHVVFSRCFQRF